MKIDTHLIISDKASFSFEVRLMGTLDGDIAELDLHSNQFNLLSIKDYDFYGCLIKIREHLEQKKLFILCQGSAKNVHPSGMARQMSSGLKAYSLKLGKKVSLEDIVQIFDPAPVDMISTIADQEQFFKNWIEQSKK